MGRVCDVAKLPLGPGQEQESRWHVPACQAEVPNYFPTGAAVYRCVPGGGGGKRVNLAFATYLSVGETTTGGLRGWHQDKGPPRMRESHFCVLIRLTPRIPRYLIVFFLLWYRPCVKTD